MNAAELAKARPMPAHGTLSRYCNQKCRCDECREANRVYKNQYRPRWLAVPENAAKTRARQAADQAANPEKWREYYRRHHAKHRDKRNAWSRENYAQTREAHMDYVRQYRARNPEAHREANSRRRARLRNGVVVPYRRRDIYERDRGLCHICGLSVDVRRWDIDHIVPLAAGGADAPWNVAVSHPRCNCVKGRAVG